MLISNAIIINSGSLFLVITIYYEGLKRLVEWAIIRNSVAFYISGIASGVIAGFFAYLNFLYLFRKKEFANINIYLGSTHSLCGKSDELLTLDEIKHNEKK